MVSRPDGDPLAIQNRPDVVRMDTLDDERQHTGPIPGPRTDEPKTGHAAQRSSRVVDQLTLPVLDGVEAQAGQEVDGRRQS